MKMPLIGFCILILAVPLQADNYRVDWHVVGSGGSHMETAVYQVIGTVGQALVGQSFSAAYMVESGFWVGFGVGCKYIPGNSNGVAPFNGIDITYSVNYLKGIGPAPPDTCDCPQHGLILAAADANGDCGFNGIDVSYSVNYLKGFGPAPRACVDCLPVNLAFPAYGKQPQIKALTPKGLLR